jgi:hypothetical protein
MIACKDFVPKMLSAGGIFSSSEFEDFAAALKAANQWITDKQIDVVNIETVVLPNVWSAREKGPRDPELRIPPNTTADWNQFIRVWYRKEG